MASASKTIVVFQFINGIAESSAPPPPNRGADYRRNERNHHQNDPTQVAQGIFAKTKGERLWNFRRDADELLAAEQPVHGAGNEIERLLFLGNRVVVDESRIADDHHARGIHLHS